MILRLHLSIQLVRTMLERKFVFIYHNQYLITKWLGLIWTLSNIFEFFPIKLISDNNAYESYFDYTKDQSSLPLLNLTDGYEYAIPNARNEISLLNDIRQHPDVFSANNITGQKYRIKAVYDTILGSKTTAVELDKEVEETVEKKKNELNIDNKQNQNVS